MMRFSTLKTHWTPDDAHAILSLLDELRDVLWATYVADIVEHQANIGQEKHRLVEQEEQKDWRQGHDEPIDF